MESAHPHKIFTSPSLCLFKILCPFLFRGGSRILCACTQCSSSIWQEKMRNLVKNWLIFGNGRKCIASAAEVSDSEVVALEVDQPFSLSLNASKTAHFGVRQLTKEAPLPRKRRPSSELFSRLPTLNNWGGIGGRRIIDSDSPWDFMVSHIICCLIINGSFFR